MIQNFLQHLDPQCGKCKGLAQEDRSFMRSLLNSKGMCTSKSRPGIVGLHANKYMIVLA